MNIYLCKENQIIEIFESPDADSRKLILKHAELNQYQVFESELPPAFELEVEQFKKYDLIQKKWVIDIEAKFNFLKNQKLEEIKTKEAEKLEDGFLYTLNGTQYKLDSNQKAQVFISGLLTALNSGIISGLDGYTVEDTQGNNIEVNLTGYQIIEVAGAILNRVKTIHSWKRTKEDELKLISYITDLELFEVV